MSQQTFTRINTEYGLAVIVTQIRTGYAVTFIDTDAQQIIDTRLFAVEANAITYANNLIAQESRGGAVLI
jgi:hypothetical protein